MSVINISGIEFNVIYIDPSNASPGDGSTPLTALTDIPTFANLTSGTAYLIRRLGSSYELNFPYGTSNLSSLNYVFIAMPKTTDPMYELMPSEAKAAWDLDSTSNDYAFTKVTETGFTLSGSNIIFNAYRIYFYHKDLTTYSSDMFSFSSTDYTNLISFENCRFGYRGYELDEDQVSITASEISESKTIYYDVSGASESICNGKYYLFSGTHGQTDAIYYNVTTNCKIYYNNDGYENQWRMHETIGSRYYWASDISGPWTSWEGTAPTVTSDIGTVSYKVSVSGGIGDINSKYYLYDGSHGTTGAVYRSITHQIYYDTDKWYVKEISATSAEYAGTSSLYGEYSKDAYWSTIPTYGMSKYISCGKINSFEMRGCKINYNANSSVSEYSRTVVNISNKIISAISNCDFNIICGTSSTTNAILSLWSSSSPARASNSGDCGSYSRIYGLNFNIYKYSNSSSTQNYIPFCILERDASFLEMKNVSVNMPVLSKMISSGVTTISLPQSYSSSTYVHYGIISSIYISEFDVNGITITLPQFWKVEGSNNGSSPAFLLSGDYISESSTSSSEKMSPTPGAVHNLKNVTITYAQGAGTGTYDGLDSSNSTGNYYTIVSNTTFAYPTCCMRIINYTVEPWDISGISLTNPHGVALEAERCWLEATTISGMIRANKSSVLNIQNLSTWYAGKAVAAFNCSTIKVDSLTCGTGGSDNPTDELACLDEIYSNLSFIYIGTSNRQMLSDIRSSSSSYSNRYSAICANEKYTGRYTIRTENFLCSTYGTFRTNPLSSVSATLRLQNNWCSSSTGLELGQPPFGGFKKTPSVTGKHVLYIYGATLDLGTLENVRANIGKNILVEVIVPTQYGNRSVVSTSGSWMLDTDSTWSDSNISATDPDATGYPMKLKLPLNIELTSSPIDIKVHYNWYSSNGVFFLDPFFTLTAIS